MVCVPLKHTFSFAAHHGTPAPSTSTEGATQPTPSESQDPMEGVETSTGGGAESGSSLPGSEHGASECEEDPSEQDEPSSSDHGFLIEPKSSG